MERVVRGVCMVRGLIRVGGGKLVDEGEKLFVCLFVSVDRLFCLLYFIGFIDFIL